MNSSHAATGDHLTRLLATGAVLSATLVLAACGGGGGEGSPTRASTTGATTTVAVKRVDGIGRVLVDAAGKALYSSDQEAGGKVRCTGGCTSFWEPLTVRSGTPDPVPGAGELDVVTRPDGARQVTANGKPLYSFSEDAPGQGTGNGFSDDFGGRHFTWNAVLAGAERAGTPAAHHVPSRNDTGYQRVLPGHGRAL
jgi:predicted lipoprotein with Yx(FWY)xxD motif